MNKVSLVFPHQLHSDISLLKNDSSVYLIEEHLFFSQYKFHKQKIAFHRATMRFYKQHLEKNGLKVTYIEAKNDLSDIRKLIPHLSEKGITEVCFRNPTDYYLEKRLNEGIKAHNLEKTEHPSLLFINSKQDLSSFFKPTKKKFFQTSFYKNERARLNLLMDEDGKPEGGKLTYDDQNRKKFPAKKTPPAIHFPEANEFHKEALEYVETNFKENYGEITSETYYPVTFEQTETWLNQFLETRFHEFGDYEDAILKEEIHLNHSMLTPMLNVGFIEPKYIIDRAIEFARKENVPLNSLEGFVRQIMGWREFIRGMYEAKGRESRIKNYWGFTRKIPASFYDGTTGIAPVDDAIKKVLKTGYSHHIERLMILGNFMLLCEFDPDEVYQWFMEMYIDSYDWVMVPNVYGMSQFADGGFFATKPYISGSNYIFKMSNYKKGADWQATWDGLFWRFMHIHRDFFVKNPRLGMLVRNFDNQSPEKRNGHLEEAEKFLEKL
ncbi:MAG: cryptochrome/photolyase family protein [Flavobacteriales bacterium]